MRNRKVTGIFNRPSDAEKLKDELLEAGVALHRIVISDKTVAVVARSPVDREHIARLMLECGAKETLETRT
ncbi:MAG TPA: hypothetical protein VNH16_17640 [Burkholderiales bacterium]|jgi:hypothetical protein|nr:hypothetical protein [Burkholderiales bacterium]